MKKLFTLFMATIVAMSMMALPQNVKLAGKKAKPASKEQFDAKTPAQAKNLEMANDAKVLRSFERPETAVKKAPAKAPLKVAAAQTADTIKLHFDGFSELPKWYEESGDWYMACSNAEGWIVIFDIFSESYVGTFTEEDLDLDYSYILNEYSESINYKKVALTITEEKTSQYLTTIKLHAVIDGSDGNVYVVTCAHEFYSPKAEVSHVITGATMTLNEMEGLATLAGKNADLDLTLTYTTTWPTGRYTKGDFDMEATKVTYKGAEQQLLDVEMLVASGMVDGTLAYVADVNYYDQDTVLNHVSITAPLAAATDTVEIELNNLQVDDLWASIFGWVNLTGASSEWDIYAGVAGMQAEEGEWAGEDEVMLHVTNKATGVETEAIYATAKMVNDDEKGWLVTIGGHCKDGKYYVVDMKFEVPEPTVFKTITFENSCAATFYPDLGNDLLLENANDSLAVGIDIFGVPMGGTFTYDQMDKNYSYLTDGDEEVMIGAVEGKVYQVGDTTRMDVVVKGFNAVQYTFELWYAVPTPTQTVKLTVDAAFDNQLESNGYYTLSGVDEATGLLVAMSPITEEVAGTFVNDGLFGKFGAEGGQYDFYANHTYVAKPAGDLYYVEKGTMTVTLDAGNNIVAKVSVICSNAVQYEITMTYKPNYLVTLKSNGGGEVYGAGYYKSGSYVTIQAESDDNYCFKQWNDGNIENPRSFIITQDTTFVAEFIYADGQCGDRLFWKYNDSSLEIIGYGDMYNYARSIDIPWANPSTAWFSLDDIKDLQLPDGMTTISKYAFNDCRYLSSVVIPSSVEAIYASAFEDCRKLEEVVFEDNSKLNLIGDWAFYNCHLLKNLQIPEGVKTLGYGAFYGCTYLQELTLPSTLVSLDDVSFALCAKLQKMNVDAIVPPTVNARTFEDVNRSIPVYVPAESVPAYKAAPVWQEFNIQPKDSAPTDLSETPFVAGETQKLIHNGQLLIIRGGKTYNAQGAVIL